MKVRNQLAKDTLLLTIASKSKSKLLIIVDSKDRNAKELDNRDSKIFHILFAFNSILANVKKSRSEEFASPINSKIVLK
jgi:monomeric isocitrate dehydrogenase